MTLNKKLSVFTLFIFIFTVKAFSLPVPEMNGRVNDYGNIISGATEQKLNGYLEALENTTGIQIAVLTIPSLKGEDLEVYSMKVVEKWKLGQKKEDNGALLLVALAERKIRIEVGYGLEDKLTDIKCGLIIRNVITPAFRNGNYSEGIYKAVMNMGGIASDNKELVAKSVMNPKENEDDWTGALFGLVFIIAWFIIFRNMARGRRSSIWSWLFLSSLLNSGSRHNYGHRSRSSGFDFGGSDFSGGGGHFGGGGASGGW